MEHIEEIADTLGITLRVSKSGNSISGARMIRVELEPGLQIPVKLTVLSAYHEPHNGLAIIVGRVAGDLGFMVYNSQLDNRECVDLALLDLTKLEITVEGYFESNKTAPISELALSFDPALVCQLRRFAGEKTFTLIDDRRVSKGGQDADASEAQEPIAIQPDDRGVVASKADEGQVL